MQRALSSPNINLDDYYGLVVFHAKRVHRRLAAAGKGQVEVAELIQEGLVGLVQARNRFDPAKRVKFETYALRRISGAITDYLRGLDPLTQSERRRVKELEKAGEILANCLQREPGAADLARSLSISEEEVTSTQGKRVVLLSMEGSSLADPEAEYPNALEFASPDANPEEQLIAGFTEREKTKLANDVNECLETGLDDMERSILILRVLGKMTLEAVGLQWNTSKDTVARRERKARSNMRQCLEKKGWQSSDIMEMIL